MITKLAEWYKILNLPGLTSETLTFRSNAVKKIAKGKTTDWLLDCIRLYLDKPIKDSNFKAELTKVFTEADQMFNQNNNDFELRVLAGAIIYETIENNKLKNRVALAIALQSAIFGISAADLINVDILKFANEFLNNEAIGIRDSVGTYETISLDGISSNLADTQPATLNTQFTELNKQLSTISKAFDSANRKIQILEEESNIHWWIFKGYSQIQKKPISEIPVIEASLLLGHELSDLTNILPPSISFTNFLNKLLKDNFSSNEDSFTIKDVVNGIEKPYKEGHLKTIGARFENICPLAHASCQSLLSDDNNSWPPIFEKSSGIKSNYTLKKEDIAKQSYFENILHKAIEEA